jgi:hypothetical protein
MAKNSIKRLMALSLESLAKLMRSSFPFLLSPARGRKMNLNALALGRLNRR